MMWKALLPAVASLCLLSAPVNAMQDFQFIRRQASGAGGITPVFSLDIPVDHFNAADTRTFSNRYWVNDTYYESGGPVFFQDWGESGISDATADYYMAENGGASAVMELARAYKGLAVMFEHRYYGLSLPFAVNDTGSGYQGHDPVGGAASYKYLTNEQALEDVVYFSQNVAFSGYSADENTKLKPCTTPWVWVGGSYSGNRGAWMRVRNPEIFYAVWSSSAPVEARFDGSLYFDPIYRSLTQNCSADAKAVVEYADAILSGNDQNAILDLKQKVFVAWETVNNLNASYDISNAASWTAYSIGSVLAQAVYNNFQSYGPQYTTEVFCGYMERYNPSAIPANPTIDQILRNPGNGVPSRSGIVATYDTATGLDAYLYALRSFLSDTTPDNDAASAPALDATADTKAWTWQYLTEFGYIQGSSAEYLASGMNIISKFYNISAVRAAAISGIFPNFSPSVFPPQPNVEAANKYGGWDMQPSNVMFTEGEFDPWRGFSVLSQETYAGAPGRQAVQTVPDCGKPPSGSDVFGLVYPGTVHVQDLHALSTHPDPATAPLNVGLALFGKALDKWLPCFQGQCNKNGTSSSSSSSTRAATSTGTKTSTGSTTATGVKTTGKATTSTAGKPVSSNDPGHVSDKTTSSASVTATVTITLSSSNTKSTGSVVTSTKSNSGFSTKTATTTSAKAATTTAGDGIDHWANWQS